MKKVYRLEGKVNGDDRDVFLDGKRLDPTRSQKVRNHSPDGFNWGYQGSGCAQTALAVLLEIYPEEQAVQLYHGFKSRVIAELSINKDFSIDFDAATFLIVAAGREKEKHE